MGKYRYTQDKQCRECLEKSLKCKRSLGRKEKKRLGAPPPLPQKIIFKDKLLAPFLLQIQGRKAHDSIENHIADQDQETNPFIDIHDLVIVQNVISSQGTIYVTATVRLLATRAFPASGALEFIAHEASKTEGLETDVGERVAEDWGRHGAERLKEAAHEHKHAQSSRACSNSSQKVGNQGGNRHH
jgi:hypothetical protein